IAINELGYIYLHGNGLPKNFEKAMEYFEKSANGGYALAFSNLGYCYLERKENEKAVDCFLKAAEQNLPIAYNNLGICYRDGLGVPKDTDKALELFKKSFDGGFMKAKTNYQKLFNAVYPGKKSEIDNFSGDILEYCNQIVAFHHVNFSIGTSIPYNKLNNFTITFPNFNAHKQKILCYWDDTVFGGGKDGFLLTDKCFYWHTFLGNPMYASVNDIASFQVGNANSVILSLKNGMSSIIPFNAKTLSNQLAAFLSKTIDYITSN
ncbi:MAG: sel1 repeat family protein, partial [Clostridia bacterium]|nr:sel1 repeat family protein [Clostridia bacterium]